jgi:hypothetical protein
MSKSELISVFDYLTGKFISNKKSILYLNCPDHVLLIHQLLLLLLIQLLLAILSRLGTGRRRLLLLLLMKTLNGGTKFLRSSFIINF